MGKKSPQRRLLGTVQALRGFVIVQKDAEGVR